MFVICDLKVWVALDYVSVTVGVVWVDDCCGFWISRHALTSLGLNFACGVYLLRWRRVLG